MSNSLKESIIKSVINPTEFDKVPSQSKIIKSNSRILNNGKETRIDLPISNLIKEKDIYFESTFYVGESADDPFSSFLK